MATLALQLGDRTENDGTSWTFFTNIAKRYNLDYFQSASTKTAVESLKDGALIACSMKKGYFTNAGHIILAYGVDGDNILVHDPANRSKTKAGIDLFIRECGQYFIYTQKGKEKVMDWKQIIKNAVDKDKAEKWEKAVNTVINAVKADGCLGDLEILQFLPELIVKVKNS
jgi:hypothetical protein